MTRIAVFIDGTGNEGDDHHQETSNVFKLYRMVSHEGQSVHYVPGVGTGYGADPGWLARQAQRIDFIFGRGASERIRSAYLYIAARFVPGDEVFLFGFSRGAFIVRALAGFLDKVGRLLASHANERYVEEAFHLYWMNLGDDGPLQAYLEQMTGTAAAPDGGIPTHFLGQWDTVAALKHAGITVPTEMKLADIHRREQYQPLPGWIRHARHALALHEMRDHFEPVLWAGYDHAAQTLHQAWFAGAHADVGGGYDPADGVATVFSEASLEWMRAQAAEHGLKFIGGGACRPIGNHAPHVSWAGTERAFPAGVRPALADHTRPRCLSEYLHDSVFDRLWSDVEATLPADAAVARHWRDADAAAMGLHYRSAFPQAAPVPALSPGRLQAGFALFCRAVDAGHADGMAADEMAPDEVARILPLIAIFGYEGMHRALPDAVRGDWDDHLRAAGHMVETRLAAPDHAYLRYRKARQAARFEHFVYRILFPPRPPGRAAQSG